MATTKAAASELHAAITQLLDGTHCPKHGMEWEECCLAEVSLELHHKIMQLLNTRDLAIPDAADLISREAVITEIERMRDDCKKGDGLNPPSERCRWFINAAERILRRLRALPAAPAGG